jgi:hypothetical protein
MNWQIIRRAVLGLALGIVVAIGLNEGSFFFLKSAAGRAPRTIELVIPSGTSERVARGQPSPSIPDGMVFVIGDTLVVKNEDATDHHLGPLFIPSGTSASLNLAKAENFAFECSFRASKYFGLDVREPVTWGTRLYGIIFAGVPLGALLTLYSFILWPLKPGAGTERSRNGEGG